MIVRPRRFLCCPMEIQMWASFDVLPGSWAQEKRVCRGRR